MVDKSPILGVVGPLPNGLFMSGRLILTTYDTWDESSNSFIIGLSCDISLQQILSQLGWKKAKLQFVVIGAVWDSPNLQKSTPKTRVFSGRNELRSWTSDRAFSVTPTFERPIQSDFGAERHRSLTTSRTMVPWSVWKKPENGVALKVKVTTIKRKVRRLELLIVSKSLLSNRGRSFRFFKPFNK